MNDINNRRKGAAGEQIAVDFLIRNNYSIIKTNYRVGRIGEIDIIAKDGEYICFVEVKTRNSYDFGIPSEAVNPEKQHKIKTVASIYLSNTGKTNSCVRFDIVEIKMKKKNETYYTERLKLIKNAF